MRDIEYVKADLSVIKRKITILMKEKEKIQQEIRDIEFDKKEKVRLKIW